jgi:plasmid stabilization system protein ParE
LKKLKLPTVGCAIIWAAMRLSNWYYDLQDAIASLQQFPYRCSVAPEATIIGREIRQLWVGKGRTYRILFVVEGDTVAIVHIRHRRQAPLGTESSD